MLKTETGKQNQSHLQKKKKKKVFLPRFHGLIKTAEETEKDSGSFRKAASWEEPGENIAWA